MPSTVIVGGFYGDEGKGKIVSYLAMKDNPVIAVRGGVGPNAGHTIEHEGKKYKVRMLPSAFLNPNTRLLVGPGVVLSLEVLLKEISEFGTQDRSFVDYQCGIIDDSHRTADSQGRLKESIGSTGTGTGPANADRAMRTLKLAKEIDSLALYLDDIPNAVNFALERKEQVIVEGTQGTFLSLWHGTYPYVTSKDVTASGICADVGIGPKSVDEVVIVFKSFVTRVGEGPLKNEISPEQAVAKGWQEVGTVTGRQRRAAEFDFELAKRSIMLNSATQIAITKLDVVYPECAHMQSFSDLSSPAKYFIKTIEDKLKVPVTLIGTGPEVNDTIDRRNQ
ncbi:Adenylosuccinate synthetase [Candidatus Nitrosotalea sp. TS]|uniref:adenylosuccinate synthetase n=1 Tax=Candidatus Nitrosotalea sp. TS TaxID=2341020 RepID=UPI00140A4268|nr:adenylosuccinate synthetase [Candidatus Nitrosotalea sp. TS]MDE1826352.1 adenylosuccinate synthetase [Nitrososphaerota archaeon]NHI03265.1 Adenylosuccinate synthetase [Candidatus Nitrosotalea sp. TS]